MVINTSTVSVLTSTASARKQEAPGILPQPDTAARTLALHTQLQHPTESNRYNILHKRSLPIGLLHYLYRVIHEESAILWEMIVCGILSKKVHMNMCPIIDGYGVTGIF